MCTVACCHGTVGRPWRSSVSEVRRVRLFRVSGTSRRRPGISASHLRSDSALRRIRRRLLPDIRRHSDPHQYQRSVYKSGKWNRRKLVTYQERNEWGFRNIPYCMGRTRDRCLFHRRSPGRSILQEVSNKERKSECNSPRFVKTDEVEQPEPAPTTVPDRSQRLWLSSPCRLSPPLLSSSSLP